MNFEKLPNIGDCKDLKGKRVMVRMSFDVPIKDEKIADDSRIKAGLPTIEFLRSQGAKVIIIGHIGREKSESLSIVAEYLEKHFPVVFVKNIMGGGAVSAVENMAEGDVVLFENLRQNDGETNNDVQFAQHLAHFADIYVNDDFPVAHRSHASVVGIPKYIPGYFGFRFVEEVSQLSKAFNPAHPFVFILGGAKVETKSPLLKKFISKADTVFVGGVLANDFFKVMGHEIGKSVTSSTEVTLDVTKYKNIMLPSDVMILRNEKKYAVSLGEVGPEDAIFDVGPETVKVLNEKIKTASFVLWNGPLGYCEKDFCDGTLSVAKALSESSAESIFGGGDTIAAVSDDVSDKFTFVSMAGGAMLDFLANETLPALEAVFLNAR